eukprot:scaffold5718_cov265-Chaetoceros_neogracile.AAC.5
MDRAMIPVIVTMIVITATQKGAMTPLLSWIYLKEISIAMKALNLTMRDDGQILKTHSVKRRLNFLQSPMRLQRTPPSVFEQPNPFSNPHVFGIIAKSGDVMSAIENLNESEDHVSNNAILGESIIRTIEGTGNDDR